MAKSSICHGAKDALERQLRSTLMPFSPVVLTSDQEDAVKHRKVYWNTNYKLWKLKSNQPHLFANMERLRTGAGDDGPVVAALPPGFEQLGEGWLLHKEKQLYVEEGSQRCLWYDGAGGVYREVHGGEDLTSDVAFLAGASTSSSSSSSSSSSKAPASAARTPASSSSAAAAAAGLARHIVISDLHKAADAFKLDLNHFDRPAAMLALYKQAEGALAPDIAAKIVHERLLKRLAACRGAWIDEALQAVVVEVLASVAADHKAQAGVAGVLALAFGQRLVVVASHGAACAIADALPGDMKDVRIVASSTSRMMKTACARLDDRSAACVLLYTEAIDEKSARQAAVHAERGRPRAGAVSLFHGGIGKQEQPQQPAEPSKVAAAGGSASAKASQAAAVAAAPVHSRAAACLHLAWTGADGQGADDAGPAAKRARTEDKPSSVRCRQVLIKYAGCKQPTDTVRRKPVKRSLAEAEAAALAVLSTLEGARGTTAAEEATFTKQVRAISECQSSLKGGDLAGDIGWLKLPEVKPGEKITKEAAQRMIVVKAALGLAVHEVSDIIVNDEGVHLLKRAA